MHWEQLAATEMGLDWNARVFGPVPFEHCEIAVEFPWPGRSRASLLNWVALRWRYSRWLWRQRKDYELFLLRYSVHDPFQVLTLLYLGRKSLLVHHAIELDELRSFPGPMSRLRIGLEWMTGKLSVSLAKGLIGVTDEILRHQVDRSLTTKRVSAVYANGIQLPVESINDHRLDTPTFLFVASDFEPWQGLDVLVSSASTSSAHFLVHIVGSVSDALQQSCRADSRFVLHGALEPSDIRKLAAESWIGVSSLALWRQGLSEACALKVRDYLAWGLPSAGNYSETLPEDFPYYVKTDPDIESLLRTAYKFRETTRSEVAAAAAPYISKAVALAQLQQTLDATWPKLPAVEPAESQGEY